ncbi:MAG: NADH-quinone oxidoreductase subunit L, partial [Flavitalea sp.]
MIWLVPLLPLIGFLINGLGRNSLSKSLVGIIACGVMLASFVISVLVFFEVKNGNTAVINLFEFIQVGKL